MNRFVKGEIAPRQPQIDERDVPKMCQFSNCRSRYPGHGRPRVRGFADIAFTASDGTPVALCCEHYHDTLYRAGKGRFSDITGHQTELTPELVRAHWQRLDMAESQRARLPLEEFPS